MTAALASTQPSNGFGDGSNAGEQPADAVVSMDLGDGWSAQVSVAGVGTTAADYAW